MLCFAAARRYRTFRNIGMTQSLSKGCQNLWQVDDHNEWSQCSLGDSRRLYTLYSCLVLQVSLKACLRLISRKARWMFRLKRVGVRRWHAGTTAWKECDTPILFIHMQTLRYSFSFSLLSLLLSSLILLQVLFFWRHSLRHCRRSWHPQQQWKRPAHVYCIYCLIGSAMPQNFVPGWFWIFDPCGFILRPAPHRQQQSWFKADPGIVVWYSHVLSPSIVLCIHNMYPCVRLLGHCCGGMAC